MESLPKQNVIQKKEESKAQTKLPVKKAVPEESKFDTQPIKPAV